MRKLKRSINSQLIVLLVLSVLAAQVPIAALFLSRADSLADMYEERFQVDKIVNTYSILPSFPINERDTYLEAASGLELSFTVTDSPRFTDSLKNQKYQMWFSERINNQEIFYGEERISVIDQWYFWFSDQEEQCFDALFVQNLTLGCPYKGFSVQVKDGIWLNAVSNLGSNSKVILVPVLLSAFITLIGFIIVISIAIKKITQPLRELEKAAELLGRGQQIELNDDGVPKELSSTINAFNTMQERLSRFIYDRTHMLAAISHDLRTPITSLRIRVEFILNEKLRRQMTRTLDEMQVMVESCLSFAHQDITEEEPQRTDLIQLLQQTSNELNHVEFSSDIEQYFYPCRKINLKRAFRNIIENGIKYGERVDIKLESTSSELIVNFQDYGQGVPQNKLEELFEPFVRLDSSRNIDSGSVGLGLTIARTIVHKHGGTISINNSEFGLIVSIFFPLLD